jgi:hypothetical protein
MGEDVTREGLGQDRPKDERGDLIGILASSSTVPGFHAVSDAVSGAKSSRRRLIALGSSASAGRGHLESVTANR